jgi:hypothetical protein
LRSASGLAIGSRLKCALHEQASLRIAGEIAPERRQSPFAGDPGLPTEAPVARFLDEAEVD